MASQDSAAIEALLDTAFGPGRHRRTAYAIRDGMRWLPDLSYALVEDDGRLAGLLQSWPVALHDADGSSAPLIMVGPALGRATHADVRSRLYSPTHTHIFRRATAEATRSEGSEQA